jgi:peptidoglycan/LPS O-acetylase OafA/YrhL
MTAGLRSAGPGPGLRGSDSDHRTYRADIDGLRAVAVALVVAFHYGVPHLDGGYLGVDLFFVISGFLIASIFARGEIVSIATLARFYGRRIKRLMPAFLVVAAATVAVATAIMLPDDYDVLLTSVRESLSFSANRFFARVTTDYFAANAAQLPWLHTWSLSVEWQFYAVFPFVYLAVETVPSARVRVWSWTGLVVLATAVSIAIVAQGKPDAYFSATARIFEFLLGALATRVPPSAATRAAARWFPAVGVATLVACALTFDAATPFPGLDALWVCLIGFGLIVLGRHGSFLAHPALAWIGRRSYAIYLWHWPVVAFSNYLQRDASGWERLLWAAGVVLLADATYRLVERPGQRLSWKPVPVALAGCLLPFAAAAMFTTFARRHDGFPARLGGEAQHAYANFKAYETHDMYRCHNYVDADIEPCAFGDLAASTLALMIGDSHARRFHPFVQLLATEAHVKVYGMTDSACTTLEGSADRVGPRYRDACVAATARDFALIRSRRFRFVILAERWIGYRPEALAGLDRSLAAIVEAGAIPIVFGPIAEDGTVTKDCFNQHIKLHRSQVEHCSIAADNAFGAASKRAVQALLRDMARKYPTLVLIDPQAVQCERGSCATVIDGTPIYSDEHHLNEFGATMLGRAWRARYGNPLVP